MVSVHTKASKIHISEEISNYVLSEEWESLKKCCVSEIRVKQICVNQEVGVIDDP